MRATKERILAAASEAFAREGYGATTVEAIAQHAGTAPASVYNHFESKAGVAQALAEDALAAHDRYVAAAWALEVSPLERLIAAAGAILAFALEQPTLFQAMSLSYLQAARPVPRRHRRRGPRSASAANSSSQQVVTNLEEAIDAGELAPMDVARDLALHHGGLGRRPDAWKRAPTPTPTRSPPPAAGIRAIIKGAAAPAILTRDGRLRSRYERALVTPRLPAAAETAGR